MRRQPGIRVNGPPDRVRPVPASPAPAGPGTELKAILASLFAVPKNCQCNARAAQMDAWGVEGCRRRRAEIVAWLEGERKRRGWLEGFRAAAMAVVTGVAFQLSPSDPVGSLVDEAIRRAEEKEKANAERLLRETGEAGQD